MGVLRGLRLSRRVVRQYEYGMEISQGVRQVADLPVMHELDDPNWGTNFDWINDDLFGRDYQGLMRTSSGVILAYTNHDVGGLAVHPKCSHQTLTAITTDMQANPGLQSDGIARLLEHGSFVQRAPLHKPNKQMTIRRFTAQMVPELQREFSAVVAALLDQWLDGGELDFVSSFARKSVAQFWCRTIGLTEEESAHLVALAGDVNLLFKLAPSTEDVNTCNRSSVEYLELFTACLRRGTATGDYPMLSALVADYDATENAVRPPDPFTSFAINVVDGFHTLPVFISGLISGLVTAGLQPADFSTESSTFAAAVFLEGTRLHPALTATYRQATEDFIFDDVFIPEDSNIAMLWLFSNRDPALFTDPKKFLLERPNRAKQHAFGGGIYGCSGRNLVKALCETLLTEFATRRVRITPTGESHWQPATLLHELDRLPVELQQASS
jgi:cytochrome P450